MIESNPAGYGGMVLAMALAAYLTRIGGYWLIGRVAIGKRTQRMLDALPGAVIASIVMPIMIQNGPAAMLALATAILTMILLRSDFAAVLAGAAVAALSRAAGL